MGALLSRVINHRRGHHSLPDGDSDSDSSSVSSVPCFNDTTELIPGRYVEPQGSLSLHSRVHPIQKLPQDLILKIFSFLDVITLCRCAQVSRLWRDMALHGSNWRHIDLFEFQIGIEGEVVERMSVRCGGFLRTLSLKDCKIVEDTALDTFARNCQYIETLILTKCSNITDDTAQSLSRHCPNLNYLDLSSCRQLTDQTCIHLSEGCMNLEYIDLSYCAVGKEGINALVSKCKRLKHIIAKYCGEVNDSTLMDIGSHCRGLVTLNVYGCKNVSDAGVGHVCDNCPSLERLSVSGCESLSDLSLRKLGGACPQLKLLEAAGCSHFTDAGFKALATGCNNLQQMDLEECVQLSDATLRHLSLHCPRIQRLALSHCERITDTGIRHLVNGGCSQTLTALELDNCPFITDQSLELLRNCLLLKRLEIFDCQMVSRSGIHRLERARSDLKVHAFFPSHTTPPPPLTPRRRSWRCCTIL